MHEAVSGGTPQRHERNEVGRARRDGAERSCAGGVATSPHRDVNLLVQSRFTADRYERRRSAHGHELWSAATLRQAPERELAR
jgi:hypothetical protein